jgi:Flp pilus assembly protein TadB
MNVLKKNRMAILVIMVAGILMLAVNRLYEERIRQIEEKLPDLHNTSVRKTD